MMDSDSYLVQLWARMVGRFGIGRTLVVLAVVPVVAVASTVVGIYAYYYVPTYSVTVQFSETPGLYAQNRVSVLGVPVGRVDSVKPEAGYVDVVLTLPKSLKVPAGVTAFVLDPNPVSDRSVELSPPYTGGPVLRAGSVIPISQSVVPLEFDQVLSAVDGLAKALGPHGANSHGALSDVLHSAAQLSAGNGQLIHHTLLSVAASLPALTSNDQLEELLAGLKALTTTLVQRNTVINSLYGGVATATNYLAEDRTDLAAAIANLQSGLAEVAAFLKRNQGTIGSSVSRLSQVVNSVASQQRALATTLQLAPLGFQNFNNAVLIDGPCPDGTMKCPAIFGRVSFAQGSGTIPSSTKNPAVETEYCGNAALATLPIVQYSASAFLSQHGIPVPVPAGPGNTLNSLCVSALAVIQGIPPVRGAPPAPNLELSQFLGHR